MSDRYSIPEIIFSMIYRIRQGPLMKPMDSRGYFGNSVWGPRYGVPMEPEEGGPYSYGNFFPIIQFL